jgi:D-beta-D-heptose 7-phosphate kinase/D-beta-D-heptose 1-phosphate adenosyltransferase
MISGSAAVIVGDYGKGVVTQALLEEIKTLCRKHGLWLSMDPKPVHHLNLTGLSLITPNRKEAFELARLPDETRNPNPLADANLMRVAERLLNELRPVLLLITLGELGMLLCQREQQPFHIPTVAQEVFDVSGAGDTVIATFTLAIAAGASAIEAAILSNHAAGIVVGKVGTATVSSDELLASFKKI